MYISQGSSLLLSVNMKSLNFVLLLVCVAFATVFSLPNKTFQPRIVNGEDAKEGQFPYQASIRLKDNYHRCGGSVLNNRFVLTAAHCTDGDMSEPSNLIIVVGALYPLGGGIPFNVDKVVQHPGWDIEKILHDISLLRSAEIIAFSDLVQPIALPKYYTPANTKVVMSGWGMTSVSILSVFVVSESFACVLFCCQNNIMITIRL